MRATGGVTPLDFQARREVDSASWQRADPDAALIERIAWNTWLVVLPDGEHVHEVTLERRHGAYVGDCEIRGGDRRGRYPHRGSNGRRWSGGAPLMAIAELLSFLGVGGSIITVVTAAFALYHGRSILLLAARVGTWLRIAGVIAFLLVLAASGLIPCVDLSIQFGTLADAIGSLWELVPKPSLPEVERL